MIVNYANNSYGNKWIPQKTPVALELPCQFAAKRFQRPKTGNGFPADRLGKSASKALILNGFPTQKGCFSGPKIDFFPQFSRTAGNSDAAPLRLARPPPQCPEPQRQR